MSKYECHFSQLKEKLNSSWCDLTKYFIKLWKIQRGKMLSQKLCSDVAKGAWSSLFCYPILYSFIYTFQLSKYCLNGTKDCKIFEFLFWFPSSQGYFYFLTSFPKFQTLQKILGPIGRIMRDAQGSVFRNGMTDPYMRANSRTNWNMAKENIPGRLER